MTLWRPIGETLGTTHKGKEYIIAETVRHFELVDCTGGDYLPTDIITDTEQECVTQADAYFRMLDDAERLDEALVALGFKQTVPMTVYARNDGEKYTLIKHYKGEVVLSQSRERNSEHRLEYYPIAEAVAKLPGLI